MAAGWLGLHAEAAARDIEAKVKTRYLRQAAIEQAPLSDATWQSGSPCCHAMTVIARPAG